MGSSIIEAFARNGPVVATCAGGIPELVINEQTGILCEIKNPKQLAQGVIKLLNDMALKNSLIANASNHLSGFTKEVTAQKTLEAYRRITNEKF